MVHRLRTQQQPKLDKAPPRPTACSMPRLQAMTWNPGGLSQSGLVELRMWLHQHPIDVMIVPETKWSFSNNWSDDRWTYVRSASGTPRVGGILVMISKKLINSSNITYDYVIPGRLLHVHLGFDRQSITIVAAYQHAFDHSADNFSKRAVFWDTFDQFLYRLPRRTRILCGGDYNCTLPGVHPWTGSFIFRWKGRLCSGHQHKDASRFLQILQNHGLTALNSWSTLTGPTFFIVITALVLIFF